MSEERKKVLQMLAEGKIDTDEADRLLEKLNESAGRQERKRGHGRFHRVFHGKRGEGERRFGHGRFHRSTGEESEEDGAAPPEEDEGEPCCGGKYLRVLVEGNGGDEVNVRVPMQLIRTGIKLSALLPSDTNAKLAAKGINLAELASLSGEELVDALRDLQVDVDSSSGDKVRVFCE